VSSSADDPLVLVGEINAPFGILGQMKLRPLMGKPQVLAKLPAVVLHHPDGRDEHRRILKVHPHNSGAVVITVEGVAERNGAEALRGVQIFIRRVELPPLDDDEYYESELVGLQVVTESGRDLGTIEEVLFYPANDVYQTAVAMIPAVGDIVVKVDVAAGTVLVRDIPGLRTDE